MRFKRIKRVPFAGNSDRNLILRQQFALNMIKLIRAGMRVINVDETELTKSDFRRRKWRVPGTTNSMRNPLINPRISLIAGVGNHGELYLSLLQVNTNADVIKMYLTALAMRLDQERPDWRKDTVIQFDGAPYHKSKETREHAESLGMSLIISGPQSYDAAPAELFFGKLKRQDLNPASRATGKR